MLALMQSPSTPITPKPQRAPNIEKRSWLQAYGRFLMSPQESFILKIAPLAFLIGAPELIASEFIPIVGEINDLAALVIALLVAARTIRAVNRYRAY